MNQELRALLDGEPVINGISVTYRGDGTFRLDGGDVVSLAHANLMLKRRDTNVRRNETLD